MNKRTKEMIAKATAAALCVGLGIVSIGGNIPTVYAAEETSEVDGLLTSEDGTCTYRILEDGTAGLVYYTAAPEEQTDENGNQVYVLQFPDTIDGKAVSEIGPEVFNGSEPEIQTVQSYTGIIKLPASLVSFDISAFDDLLYLNEFQISEDNPYYSVENGILFNKDKTKLLRVPEGASSADEQDSQRYVIPESVKEIGDKAFYNCIGIQKITISKNVQSIGTDAFYRYLGMEYKFVFDVVPENEYFTIADRSLFSKDMTVLYRFVEPEDESGFGINLYSYTVPDTVKVIASCAFQGCGGSFAGLIGVTIPNSVEEIGESAFEKCNLLGDADSGSIVIPDSVVKIGDRAFTYCEDLKKVQLSAGLKSIGDEAFSDCHQLDTVTLPESLETIGEQAFYGTLLTSIDIPAGVTEIGDSAFGYVFDADNWSIVKQEDFTVGYTTGSVAEKWAADNGFKAGNVITPSEVPTTQPSEVPSTEPSGVPTTQPSEVPSAQPSGVPTTQPSGVPSAQPSGVPTTQPSGVPSAQPSGVPSATQQPAPTKAPVNRVQKPKAPKLSSVKNISGKKLVIKWKKSSGVAGYQISYAQDKKFKKAVNINAGKNAVKVQIKKLKKKTYYVRVRAYVKNAGKKVYSNWSSTKKIKVNK